MHGDLAAMYEKTEPKLVEEARHYAAHSREAAEALRSLAKRHQELAKEHASKKWVVCGPRRRGASVRADMSRAFLTEV